MLQKFIKWYNIVCLILLLFFIGLAIGFFYSGTPIKGYYSAFFAVITGAMMWVTNNLVKQMTKKKK